MRLHGNQVLLDPGLVPILNAVSPEKMARRKEIEAELGVLTKQVEDERAELRDLASKPDSEFSSADWQKYRIGMLELNDKRETRRDLKLDLSMLPNPENQPKPVEANAFQRWVKDGSDGLSAEERKDFTGAYASYGRGKGADVFRYSDFVRHAQKHPSTYMQTASDAASGNQAVGTVIDPTVLQRLKEYGGAARYTRAIRSATGDTRRFLHMDDQAQEGEVLTAQGSNVGKQDMTIEGVEMSAKTVTSKFVDVTVEFLEDDESGMAAIMQDLCYRRIGRVMNRYITTTVANFPNGIIDTIQAQNVKSGDAATLTDWRKLAAVIFAVNAAYRGGESGMFGQALPSTEGSSGFMMHSSMESIVAQLQDGNSRPIILPSPRDSIDFQLFGFPYVVNDHMDSVAAGNHPLCWFNGRYYGIRYVGEMQFERFYDSATAADQTVRFLAKTRFDYGPLMFNAGDGRNAATRGEWGARLEIAA